MDTTISQQQINDQIKVRFTQLPKVIQTAIKSADVQKQLRQLADTSKLHIDQWQVLENNVMLTLLGFQPSEDLPKELKNDLEIPQELADELASKISDIVFKPIREELERELEHPDAKAAAVSGVEQARTDALGNEAASVVRAPAAAAPAYVPPVAPGTPPSAPIEGSVVRAPVSEAYKAGETSAARKSVHDDPYRESPA